jgi:hypothetical protein
MNLSNRGAELIGNFEGFVDHPYNDLSSPAGRSLGFPAGAARGGFLLEVCSLSLGIV